MPAPKALPLPALVIPKSLAAEIAACMLQDQHRLRRRLHALRQRKGGDPAPLEGLAAEIERSRACREQRLARLPHPEFPPELPVSERREEIARAIAEHQVVIVCGETGSGKTTQLPKICLTLGRGAAGMIGHTQPRRIAARSVAARIAEELHSPLGDAVGYKVRFGDRVGPDSYVKLMTDGILLAETQSDRYLEQYDTLIIDEAHERGLNIDFLLGYLKQLLPRRPDLKLIITSATIDPERFAHHFGDAPIVSVSGRTYPVEVRYRPIATENEDERERTQQTAILDAVDELSTLGSGDVLVFLSGEREIRETAEALRKHHPPGTEILPLFARLSAAEQQRVFHPHGRRRIVLATNVAETSLTVPGIRYVVDPGFARISRYSHRTKVQRLPIEKVSRASADQRKGRCGRIAAGACIRLYSEEDYLARPEYTPPEILRSNLAAVILQMQALRLGDPEAFPFVDPPEPRMIRDGYQTLLELGAVDERQRLTDPGRQLARLPVDPRVGRMILAARDEGCLAEVLVIAAALSVQDPRERPLDAQQKADEAHRRFADERSDFLAYLKLWEAWHEQARHLSQSKLRRWCTEHFVSYVRMRDWHDIHQQLANLVKDMGLRPNELPAEYEPVHRALLAGLLGNIAFRTETHEYSGARGVKLSIFPGSGLFKKPPKWMVAAELVETARLYARTVARIEPEWIEGIAGHLIKRHYADPHWEKDAGQVAAFERVTLYGLTLVPRRRVNYGPIDPATSRELFLRGALVDGELRTRAPFFQHNQHLLEEIEGIEAKSRRRDVLVDEETLYAFYAERVPEGIYSAAAFERWRKEAERREPRLLFLTREYLMRHAAPGVTAEQFPDRLRVRDLDLPLAYRFEPGHEEDGVTVSVPLAVLNQLPPEPFEWLVPGLLKDKVLALLRALPKSLRRNFVPAPHYADAAVGALAFREGMLNAALARVLQRMTGVAVPLDAWRPEELPPHLRMHFRVLDERGKEAAKGRDLEALQQRFGARAQETFARLPTSQYERNGITRWDIGDLPDRVPIERHGMRLQGYPALADQGDAVALRLVDAPEAAAREHRAGLRRLFLLQCAQQVKYLERHLPGIGTSCLQYAALPAAPGERSPETPPCEELKRDLIHAAAERVLLGDGPLIRTASEFEARCLQAQKTLIETANELAGLVGRVLAEYHEVARRLAGPAAPATIDAHRDVREQLTHLVHRGFVAHTPWETLTHFPRYLKAIRLRLEKLPNAPGRDRERILEIAPLWRAWLQRAEHDRKCGVEDPELECYRWMLEELRVSLFAQELRTPAPVSVKRLQRQWERLSDK
jgi:ATP-dependent helicase HrpA